MQILFLGDSNPVALNHLKSSRKFISVSEIYKKQNKNKKQETKKTLSKLILRFSYTKLRAEVAESVFAWKDSNGWSHYMTCW